MAVEEIILSIPRWSKRIQQGRNVELNHAIRHAWNFVSDDSFQYWTFGKSCASDGEYHSNGAAARYVLERDFEDILEQNEDVLKRKVIQNFRQWARDVGSVDLNQRLDNFLRDDSRKFRLLIPKRAMRNISRHLKKVIKKASNPRYSSGESESHKKFKWFLSAHPEIFGISESKIYRVAVEYALPSADRVDVVFFTDDGQIAIEAKSKLSPEADILRGLFQCIKYQALLMADQIITNEKPRVETILALEGLFPKSLLTINDLLKIRVKDSIRPA